MVLIKRIDEAIFGFQREICGTANQDLSFLHLKPSKATV